MGPLFSSVMGEPAAKRPTPDLGKTVMPPSIGFPIERTTITGLRHSPAVVTYLNRLVSTPRGPLSDEVNRIRQTLIQSNKDYQWLQESRDIKEALLCNRIGSMAREIERFNKDNPVKRQLESWSQTPPDVNSPVADQKVGAIASGSLEIPANMPLYSSLCALTQLPGPIASSTVNKTVTPTNVKHIDSRTLALTSSQHNLNMDRMLRLEQMKSLQTLLTTRYRIQAAPTATSAGATIVLPTRAATATESKANESVVVPSPHQSTSRGSKRVGHTLRDAPKQKTFHDCVTNDPDDPGKLIIDEQK